MLPAEPERRAEAQMEPVAPVVAGARGGRAGGHGRAGLADRCGSCERRASTIYVKLFLPAPRRK